MRPAFDALLDINGALADVVAQSTQPALGAIKLAWWRERLEGLDAGEVPAEPRLQAAARELLTRGISGADLAELEAGWAALLEDPPETMPFHEMGIRFFRMGARLLRGELDDRAARIAGTSFMIAEAGRRGIFENRPALLDPGTMKVWWRVRPLTGLAALAKRDLIHGGPPFEEEGTPGRALALVRHRLTGRL